MRGGHPEVPGVLRSVRGNLLTEVMSWWQWGEAVVLLYGAGAAVGAALGRDYSTQDVCFNTQKRKTRDGPEAHAGCVSGTALFHHG